jgi:hypothetical protein
MYDAFISYSHVADDKFAAAVQEGYVAKLKNGSQNHLMKCINLNFKTGKLLIVLKLLKGLQ